MKSEDERQSGKSMNFKVVAKVGKRFCGLIGPSGPRGQWKTVRMYVGVASSVGVPGGHTAIPPECVTLRELREQVDKLKEDLEWVYKGMQRVMKKEQRRE